MTTEDRTVHGLTTEGHPIVRYDRSGKWYVEPPGGPRRLVSLDIAARQAIAGTVHPGQPGGRQFAARVRQLTSSHTRRSLP